MRKLLKLIIGVISSIILLMYLTLPFVKIGDDKYKVFEYIKYIFDNISMTFKNVEFIKKCVFVHFSLRKTSLQQYYIKKNKFVNI